MVTIAVWKKVVVLVGAIVIGGSPLFTRLSLAREALVEPAFLTLPQGREVDEKELMETEGEKIVVIVLIAFAVGAGLGAVYEYLCDCVTSCGSDAWTPCWASFSSSGMGMMFGGMIHDCML